MTAKTMGPQKGGDMAGRPDFAELRQQLETGQLSFRNQVRAIAAHALCPDGSRAVACTGDVHVGIFFDGTNNNKERDYGPENNPLPLIRQRHTNIVRLYHAFPDENDGIPEKPMRGVTDKSPDFAELRQQLETGQLSLRKRCVQLKGIAMPKKLLLLCCLLCLPLSGCKDDTVIAAVVGYNHNLDQTIDGFSIDGKISGPPEFPGHGGSVTCCLILPKKWRPGMQVTVYWGYAKGDDNPDPPPPQSAVVEIPAYIPENVDNLHVHFYPGHRVKVVVTRYALGSPFYPLSREDWYPWRLRENFVNNNRAAIEEGTMPMPPDEDLEWARQWGVDLKKEQKP